MDFALSKELQMLKKAVREFANKKIAPNVEVGSGHGGSDGYGYGDRRRPIAGL